MHFYLFEHKCVLAVCVHNHPVMIKIHPVFLSRKIISSFSYQARCLSVWRHTDPGPSHDCWLTLAFYLRPALSELRAVRRCFTAGTDVDKMSPIKWLSDWGVLLLDVIMNIAVVIYSQHLSRWRRGGLPLFLKGMCPPTCLNAFMFAWIIHDTASPTEEVSYKVILWIFANHLS